MAEYKHIKILPHRDREDSVIKEQYWAYNLSGSALGMITKQSPFGWRWYSMGGVILISVAELREIADFMERMEKGDYADQGRR